MGAVFFEVNPFFMPELSGRLDERADLRAESIYYFFDADELKSSSYIGAGDPDTIIRLY